jgi:hypothetical protein
MIRSSYESPLAANDAIDRLVDLGYGKGDISLIMSPKTRRRFDATAKHEEANIGSAAVAGGLIGGTMGAILATATTAGAVAASVVTGGAALPIVMGPLAAALTGIVGGSAIGALVGAAGSEEERASISREIEDGAIIVAVNVPPEGVHAAELALGSTIPA